MVRDATNADDLETLLRLANPVPREAIECSGVEHTLDQMGSAIGARSTAKVGPDRRRSRVRLRTGMIAAAVLVATATVAAAAALSAHTGQFQPTRQQIADASPSDAASMQSELNMGGPGEFLDPAAPDFRDVALQVASDIPYPPGYESWRDFLISDEIRTSDGATESSGALHGWFAASAFCAWVQDWRQAQISGNASAAARAAQVISEAPGWKAVRDEDPNPSTSVPGDMGTHYSLFGWMLPYRHAVLAGDLAGVESLLASGYGDKCWTSDPDWRVQLAAHPDWGTLSAAEMARQYEQFLADERS
jgi:hypothetical protein